MEGKNNGKEKHNCSNPNCRKVFSRPKVIKYYVCPSCQTLIDIPTQRIPERAAPIKKPVSPAKTEEVKSEPTLAQLVSNDEVALSNENAINETVDLRSDFVAECVPTDSSSDSSSLEEKVQLAVEGRKALSELNFACNYYFGFLGEKKQGQQIPETCFECPKSVDCLLSKCVKSEESIQEIKQWYTPNNQG